MRKTKEEIIKYINSLKGYQGYVQFSHRPIDKRKDIFIEQEPTVEEEKGFIYEAHFYNGKDTVTIKQINDYWLIDEIKDTSLEDTQNYLSEIEKFDYQIKMAQIWKEEADSLCAGMSVKKLQKVVFVGFEKGENNDNSTI